MDNSDIQTLMDDLGVSFGRRDIPLLPNLAPSESVPVIAEEEGSRALRPMRWWFIPGWAKEPSTQYSMFNARAETVEKSRAFNGSFRHHRVIFPMISFIEWRKEGTLKQPYEVKYAEGSMAAAGIWSHWTDGETVIDTCAMLTTAATSGFDAFHQRQPLLLNSAQADIWLKERADLRDLRALLKTPLPETLVVQAIDPKINNSRLKELPQHLPDSNPVVISA